MKTIEVHDWARAKGMAARVVGLEALVIARARLERLAAEGVLEAGFVRGSLSGFRYLEGRSAETPRSLVLLALPRPAHVITFQLADRDLELILPPTYVEYRPTSDRVLQAFRDDLGLTPAQTDLVSAPLKSLAAAGGLIRYGRNGLGYIQGMGSYFQLIGIAVSFPLESDGELRAIDDQMLELCRTCRGCRKACTSGAIGEDRFLLRAERCYTLFSESLDPMPEGMTAPSPDCIIGCLKCQKVCPANKGLLKREHTGLVFDRRETEAMLSGLEGCESSLQAEIRAGFATLGPTEGIGLFARNLRLIQKRSAEHRPEASED